MSDTNAHAIVQQRHQDIAAFAGHRLDQPYGLAGYAAELTTLYQGCADTDWPAAGTAIAALARKTAHHTTYLVARMRVAGCSWADVSDALGVTRQAAWERYRWMDGPPTV